MLSIIRYIDYVFAFLAIALIVVLFFQIKEDKSKSTSDGLSENLIPKWLNRRFTIIILSLIILIGGWVVSGEVSRRQEVYMQDVFMNRSRDLLTFFPSEYIEQLTFSNEDKETVYFKIVSDLLNNYTYHTGITHIYTLKKRGANYYLGPMSLLPDGSTYFEPGSKYHYNVQLLDRVVSTCTIQFANINEDGCGENVTYYIPLFDKYKKEVLSIIGVSISARLWKSNLFRVKLIPLALTLFLLIIVFINARWLRKRKKKSERPFYKEIFHYREGVLILLSGLIISLYIAFVSYQNGFRYHRTVFSQQAHAHGTAISESIKTIHIALQGLARLFEVSERVTNEEFIHYIEETISYPFVDAVGWAKHIRDNHYELEYIYSPEAIVSGVDFFTLERDSLKLQPVWETLNSECVTVVHGRFNDNRERVNLFLQTKDNSLNINGLVFFAVDFTKLINNVFAENAGNDTYFQVSLIPADRQEGKRCDDDKLFFLPLFRNKDAYCYGYYGFFFGEMYRILVTPLSAYYKVYGNKTFFSVLILGLLVSIVVSVIFFILINRRYLLEKQIDKFSAKLRESQSRFMSLFSHMLEGVAFYKATIDRDGNPDKFIIQDVNKSFETLTTLSYDKVVGKDAQKVLGWSKYIQYFKKVVKQKESVIFDVYFEPANKFMKISAAPWGDKGFATFFSDITKQVIAEKKLKKSEERYRLISENAGDLIAIYNIRSNRISYISPSVKKISGYSYYEVVGKKLEEVISKKSFDEIKDRIAKRIERFEGGEDSERVKNILLEIKTKSGGSVPVEVVTTLLTDKEQKVISILGVGRDIRDRLKAEEALRESEKKFRLLVENQNDLVVKVDKDGFLIYVSPSYCKLFGKSESELLNKAFLPLVHPEDREKTKEGMKKLLNPPYQVTIEQRAKTVIGWRWISWNDTAVFDKSGHLKEIIGIGRDITEQKEAEIALQKSRELLKRQNEEYAALNEEYMAMNEELSKINDELSAAIEKAEESEKLKTAFLQNMSHEIRTPLNAIIGFSEMLGMDHLTDSERKEFITIIVNSGRQLLDLVNDILTLSAIETNQDKVNLSLVNLNHLLKELFTIFKSKAEEKGIELKMAKSASDEDVSIETDELKLRQIFVNLLGNAIKFTSHGSVEFGYELERADEILCYVKDTGMGIPQEIQNRIFDRFVQADKSTKSTYGGTGLGLAICKGHVEMLGGKIWLKSTYGKGSVFYFTLHR